MNHKTFIIAALTVLLLNHCFELSVAKRYSSPSRKTSSGGGYSTRRQPTSNSGQVTKPSQTNVGTSYSHSDATKLSYAGSNSQPSHSNVASNGPGYGWNVPKQQGPPPAYSVINPSGGAKTNIHETPPAYRSNSGLPNGYVAPVGNMQNPVTAPKFHGVQSSYPAGSSYIPPGAHLPAGASYYPSSSNVPGANYYGSNVHMPAGRNYPGAQGGGTFLPAGSALPAGAVYYSQPPMSSSGLGFGSGLAAGAIGGALLGHALTPTHTRVVEQIPDSNAAGSGNNDKVIIINNGPPGTTVITASNATAPINQQDPQKLGPEANSEQPLSTQMEVADVSQATYQTDNTHTADKALQPPEQGGIICVPVRLNETDPMDTTKMIEVDKIACYPAPTLNSNAQQSLISANTSHGSTSLVPNDFSSHHLQKAQMASDTATDLPNQSPMHQSGAYSRYTFDCGFQALMALFFALLV